MPEAAEGSDGGTGEAAEPEFVPGCRWSPPCQTQPILDMDAEDLPAGARMGDMDDPAIWVHPTEAAQSVVVRWRRKAAWKYTISTATFAVHQPDGVRYNNVDLLYDVELGGGTSTCSLSPTATRISSCSSESILLRGS